MAADGGGGFVYFPIFNYDASDLEAQRELLTHPNTIIGLADEGCPRRHDLRRQLSHHPARHWGRDRVRGPRLELPWLVKAQTATADLYGLDRGRLQVGLRAT